MDATDISCIPIKLIMENYLKRGREREREKTNERNLHY